MKLFYFSMTAILLMASCQSDNTSSDAFGNFEATEVFISSEIAGSIVQFTIDEGQELAKGQFVALIDTVPLSIRKRQLEATQRATLSKLVQVNASIGVLETQKQNLQRDFDRLKKMLSDGAATQKQYDDVEGQLAVIDQQFKSHQASMASIRAEVQVIDTQLDEINDKLSRCVINSPMAGTVLQKLSEPGELTGAGKPLLKLADLENIYLRAYVSGSQLPDIKLGQAVQVRFDKDADDNQSMDGVLSWISASAEFTPKIIQTKDERVDLVYAIKVRVKNDGRIKIGMPGEVKF